ncbi:MAG: NAD(P)-dependent oxidoreductase [Bacteroidetes bacterium]|nr:NAD(P)-dependent oxidoreductase [Bacteroidota bacterium]
MSTAKIGFIGLGSMGHPMAKNLERAGFPLLVYNRTAAKSADFTAPTIVCSTVTELVLQADIIFTMLTNDAAVTVVYNEAMQVDVTGKLFVDMSTISVTLSQQIAQQLKNKQADLIDAPVAGSTKPATEGTLIILAGGESAALERAQPYLMKMGKQVVHLGENGKGLSAKIAVNYFLSLVYQGLAETVLFADHLDIERKDILGIINESAVGSGATKVKTPLLVDNNFAPAFALDLMLKDVLLAKDAGADFPLGNTAMAAYQNAHDKGLGGDDVIGIIKAL